ncbi:hypothetical protein RJ639_041145 [Escallonia herrerae]|uniref:Retroviral polymerase SH3-like domain-containing protein n=1 Tax=Escallonia herrerae TaxID=1293975 RepID=A0AA88WGY2_9ASTE|nr:hypothetical protein RJ639_041145 [Escallonia herrerae]
MGQWNQPVFQEIKEVAIRNVPISVCSVLKAISAVKPEAYTPQVIAFGPYHHMEPELYQMEKYKLATVKSSLSLEQFLNFQELVIEKLKELEPVIRACYHKYLDHDGDALAWIDGDALAWIIAIDVNHQATTTQPQEQAFCLEKIDGLADSVQHQSEEEGNDVILNVGEIVETRLKMRNVHDKENHPTVEEKTIPSVSHLSKFAGVKFSATDGGIGDMKFVQGEATLFLPIITLNANSEVVLRNLVAYEVALSNSTGKLAQYADFMCGIVDTAEDAQLLREKGIIKGDLSNEEIADLFNGMNRLSAKERDKTVDEINEYYNKRPMGQIGRSSLFGRNMLELMSGIIDTSKDAKLLRQKKIIASALVSEAEGAELFNGMSKSVQLTSVSYIGKAIEDVYKYYYAIKEKDNVWFLNSGCSNHMTGDEKSFLCLDTSVKSQVKMGNGAVVQTKGSVALKCAAEENIWLWHKRFCHLNFIGLKLLQRKNTVRGLTEIRGETDICEGPKLGKKSERCIFLGYSDESKAYRLFNLETEKLIISRGVIFNEKTFWNWKEGKVQVVPLILEEDHENDPPLLEENQADTSPQQSPGAQALLCQCHHHQSLHKGERGTSQRYMKLVRTLDYGILYEVAKEVKLFGYTNNDWAGSIDDRESTSGYAFTLRTGVISWVSKKQSSIAQSSAEAEYVAAAKATSQAIWLRRVLEDIREKQNGGTKIFCDSKSAIAIAKNPVSHERTKHIAIKYHFIRDAVEMQLKHCKTNFQVTDIFTKALPKDKFQYFREQLGVTRKMH